MGQFQHCIKVILTEEGDLSNHPEDPGGLTKYGISQRAYPNLDLRNLRIEDAEALYRRDYWQPIHGDDLPNGLALLVFDSAVNMGARAAVKLLQRTLKVTEDGIVGAATLNTAERMSHRAPIQLLIDLCAERALKYAHSETVNTFGRGWYRRLFRVYDIARSWSLNP